MERRKKIEENQKKKRSRKQKKKGTETFEESGDGVIAGEGINVRTWAFEKCTKCFFFPGDFIIRGEGCVKNESALSLEDAAVASKCFNIKIKAGEKPGVITLITSESEGEIPFPG